MASTRTQGGSEGREHVSNTSKLLDQVRSQLAPSEEALGEARRRRDITKDAALGFSGAARVFNSGSLAHATANCPVHHRDQGLDADCGVVLDRRRFPSLGPDGSGEGPNAIVDDIADEVLGKVRAEYSAAVVTVTKRAILVSCNQPLSTGEDPTVDLVVGLDRFGPNYGTGGVIETPTERFGVVSAFIVAQGPNYALAKRLQRWQMIATRADGILTSVHVAPPTRTGSVHANPIMAERQRLTAYVGIETFDAPTTEAIAGAILVHDLHNPASPANPAVPLGHPHEAFMFAANPGGRWRVPFDVGSTVPLLHEVTAARLRAGSFVRDLSTRIPGSGRLPGVRRLGRPQD